MGKIKIARKLILIGILLFIIQNCYFGWNLEPMSELEEQTDYAIRAVFYFGGVFYLMPIFDIYESLVKKHDKSKDKL